MNIDPPTSVSVVIPVFSGADYLCDLTQQLEQVKVWLSTNDAPVSIVEAIFVDDDSSDGSDVILASLLEKYPWVRVVQLTRNFGQHPATAAGILHSSGDWVCTMDEDLQHKPQDMLRLLQTVTSAGGDICYAEPSLGTHSSFRNKSSWLTKKIMSALSGNKWITKFHSFRIIRGPIARAAASVMAHQTYFDVALSWHTNRVCTISLAMKDPRAGSSKKSGYPLKRLIQHAGRLFQSLELGILKMASLLGFILMLIAAFVGLSALAIRIWFPEIITLPGWTSVLVMSVFFGGTTAFLVGLVLNQVLFLSQKMRGRPVFFTVNRQSDLIIANWLDEHQPQK